MNEDVPVRTSSVPSRCAIQLWPYDGVSGNSRLARPDFPRKNRLLSPAEQIRVDNAGDDLDRLQQVLLDIHEARLTYWRGVMEGLEEQKQNLEQVYTSAVSYGMDDQYSEAAATLSRVAQEAAVSIAGFRAAKEQIRAWKPVSFEDYQAGKLIDPRSTKQPKSDSQ